VLFYFFFFFQAEDGIRDGHVTGVQTCALPISLRRTFPAHVAILSAQLCRRIPSTQPARLLDARLRKRPPGSPRSASAKSSRTRRSEERRVGKECRARWSRDRLKKKE